LLRVGWELAGPGPAWWGALILTLGAVSAVLGVLYALMEHDLKRLLAYHSVENIGIILMGLGAAFLLAALGQPVAAALALLAGLYHVLNHAVFKALLFLGAGAVQQATHTRDLEALGGLIHRMPWTAATFLVGAAAISALPPLNGFVSEWLTFQSLLALTTLGFTAGIGGVAATGLLALTGGLAAFCFVKAFGITFLGMPRSEKAAAAREVALSMRMGMAFLAALCVVLGLFPTLVARLLAPVTVGLVGVVARPALSAWLPCPCRPRAAPWHPWPWSGFWQRCLDWRSFSAGRSGVPVEVGWRRPGAAGSSWSPPCSTAPPPWQSLSGSSSAPCFAPTGRSSGSTTRRPPTSSWGSGTRPAYTQSTSTFSTLRRSGPFSHWHNGSARCRTAASGATSATSAPRWSWCCC